MNETEQKIAYYLAQEDNPNKNHPELEIIAKTTPYPERAHDLVQLLQEKSMVEKVEKILDKLRYENHHTNLTLAVLICHSVESIPENNGNKILALAKALYYQYCRGRNWLDDKWEDEPNVVIDQYISKARQLLT